MRRNQALVAFDASEERVRDARISIEFIPTAILRDTIRPLEMSGKNKIRR